MEACVAQVDEEGAFALDGEALAQGGAATVFVPEGDEDAVSSGGEFEGLAFARCVGGGLFVEEGDAGLKFFVFGPDLSHDAGDLGEGRSVFVEVLELDLGAEAFLEEGSGPEGDDTKGGPSEQACEALSFFVLHDELLWRGVVGECGVLRRSPAGAWGGRCVLGWDHSTFWSRGGRLREGRALGDQGLDGFAGASFGLWVALAAAKVLAFLGGEGEHAQMHVEHGFIGPDKDDAGGFDAVDPAGEHRRWNTPAPDVSSRSTGAFLSVWLGACGWAVVRGSCAVHATGATEGKAKAKEGDV